MSSYRYPEPRNRSHDSQDDGAEHLERQPSRSPRHHTNPLSPPGQDTPSNYSSLDDSAQDSPKEGYSGAPHPSRHSGHPVRPHPRRYHSHPAPAASGLSSRREAHRTLPPTYHGEVASRRPNRRRDPSPSPPKHRARSRSRSQSSTGATSPSRTRNALSSTFSDSSSGIGYSVLGAIIGGITAREWADSELPHAHSEREHERRKKKKLVSALFGAAIGGLGANALEKKLEHEEAQALRDSEEEDEPNRARRRKLSLRNQGTRDERRSNNSGSGDDEISDREHGRIQNDPRKDRRQSDISHERQRPIHW